MTKITRNNIVSEEQSQFKNLTLGAYLKHIRQQKGISLETVSQKTKIILPILEAIEKDDYQNLPPQAYLKGMIVNYAHFLKLNKEEILSLYEKSKPKVQSSGKNDVLPRNRFVVKSPAIFHLFKIILIYLIKASVFVIIVGYLTYEILFFVLPPKIILLSPRQDISLNQSQIFLRGRVIRGKMLFWGTTPIPLDSKGNFQMEINLMPGLNKIQLRAINNIGKESLVTRNIIYNQPLNQVPDTLLNTPKSGSGQ